MFDLALLTEENERSVLGFAQAAVDAYVGGTPSAARGHLMDLRDTHGESGLYLAAVVLASNLDRKQIEVDDPNGHRGPRQALSHDELDALRFAAAVQEKDRPAADEIWNRLVAEQRQEDLAMSMLSLFATIYAKGKRSVQTPFYKRRLRGR
ncbi:hypothetical protein [Saccharopolyspora phatthalungensis]|uniref:Uncharacterized protein n=1 Tax=Saccharopolyspora phatthalungensis TaxID=664693 RepID=A0A840QII4_9PSEU|nr:hypothetical protein [Saccharopolyspora phatthalungensis]MBB5158688.1 hypothetical protein [Saccharopolyspora phatthalungensis]